MNRRKSLYIIGSIIGIGISKSLISKWASYKEEDSIGKAVNGRIIKQVNCKNNSPIMEYMRENQPNLHLKFISKVKNRRLDVLNYDDVLEDLNNLEFMLVGGFFLSFSEIQESYNSNSIIRKVCL